MNTGEKVTVGLYPSNVAAIIVALPTAVEPGRRPDDNPSAAYLWDCAVGALSNTSTARTAADRLEEAENVFASLVRTAALRRGDAPPPAADLGVMIMAPAHVIENVRYTPANPETGAPALITIAEGKR